jgi:hypothetical protein
MCSTLDKPRFPWSRTAVEETLGGGRASMIILCARQQEHGRRCQPGDLLSRRNLRDARTQAKLSDTDDSPGQRPEPGWKNSPQPAHERAFDIVVEALQDDGLAFPRLLGRKADRSSPHGEAKDSSGFLRPTGADQLEDSGDIATFVVTETRASALTLTVSAMVEQDTSTTRTSQEFGSPKHLFAVGSQAVVQSHCAPRLGRGHKPAGQPDAVRRMTGERLARKTPLL